jgi:uncharacterized phiE125 gp8 family phage protein
MSNYWTHYDRMPERWQTVRAQPPVIALMTLAEARSHLRLDACDGTHPDDALVTLLIAAVTSELDGVDGWLGRALQPQSYRLILDRFPCYRDRIRLPMTSPQTPGVMPITHVRYLDDEGITVDLDDWVVAVASDPIYLLPAPATAWPDVRCQPGAVEILYDAGYEAIPEMIRAYAKVRLGQLYEFRELVVAGVSIAPVPYLLDSLENFRARWHSPV